MRTNIEIDDDLMAEAMRVTGLKTKKETVEAALKKVVGLATQSEAVEAMRGLGWEGDLDEMRRSWSKAGTAVQTQERPDAAE